mmetsp:Transcript_10293/g.22650  ORF Transcript_10293/g.22650 Transcript_10293/m.22650 type:complete len:100 (-) Transcript_10293:634-933(-)
MVVLVGEPTIIKWKRLINLEVHTINGHHAHAAIVIDSPLLPISLKTVLVRVSVEEQSMCGSTCLLQCYQEFNSLPHLLSEGLDITLAHISHDQIGVVKL